MASVGFKAGIGRKMEVKKVDCLAMAAAEPRFRGDSETNGGSIPVDLREKGVYSSYTFDMSDTCGYILII
jgi:hypothetical protein